MKKTELFKESFYIFSLESTVWWTKPNFSETSYSFSFENRTTFLIHNGSNHEENHNCLVEDGPNHEENRNCLVEYGPNHEENRLGVQVISTPVHPVNVGAQRALSETNKEIILFINKKYICIFFYFLKSVEKW